MVIEEKRAGMSIVRVGRGYSTSDCDSEESGQWVGWPAHVKAIPRSMTALKSRPTLEARFVKIIPNPQREQEH
ncbi:hypothetical protein CF327_g615 [Tilletia walkeri]|nr:hypothetical protein CF327_g615 [Tilletia walkeri]